jgi:hypothetical protein
MRYSSDKNINTFRQQEADLFNETINQLSLIELPLMDRAFTWSNNRQNPTLQKLIELSSTSTGPNRSPTPPCHPKPASSPTTFPSLLPSQHQCLAPPFFVLKIVGPHRPLANK